eukprot:9023534-Alexandrium_andersonii.AAC.1
MRRRRPRGLQGLAWKAPRKPSRRPVAAADRPGPGPLCRCLPGQAYRRPWRRQWARRLARAHQLGRRRGRRGRLGSGGPVQFAERRSAVASGLARPANAECRERLKG